MKLLFEIESLNLCNSIGQNSLVPEPVEEIIVAALKIARDRMSVADLKLINRLYLARNLSAQQIRRRAYTLRRSVAATIGLPQLNRSG
jgi:hypothetical protein